MSFDQAIPSTMSLDDLQRLVKTGEGTFLEFKRAISSPKKIGREIAAFANTNGGTLLIGVDDNKTLIGVLGYHEEEFLLNKAADDLCSPSIQIDIKIVHFGERDIMVVYVPEADRKPIYVRNGSKKRDVYIREDDKSVVATEEAISIMKNETSEDGVTFEYGPNEQKLFRYLNEYEKITVNDFSNLIDVTSYRASQILVNLVSAGILETSNQNSTEYYSFSVDCM